MNELDQLVPAGVVVHAGGEDIHILPLKIGRIPAFLREVGPVLHQLRSPPIDWIALFADQGERLLVAIGLAIGKTPDWVEELNADEALLLAAKVIEVNADFFTRNVMPRLSGLFEMADSGPKAAAVGSTQSSG